MIPHGDVSVIRYLTWRNIFGILLLAILVMIWPLELIGWYSLHTYPNGSPVSKINAITGHVFVLRAPGEVVGKPIWQRIGE